MKKKATSAERSKAARLRRARSAGKISAPDSAWLDAYESERREPRSLNEIADRVDREIEVDLAELDAAPPRARPQEDLVPIFIDNERASSPSREASGDDGDDDDTQRIACPVAHDHETFPNGCPACRSAKGGTICATTGSRVWPPMSEDGAEGLANVLLTVIGAVIKFFREDKRFIVPSDAERKALARALREIALRRASWVGAVDDLIAGLWGVSRYGMRAMREESVTRALPKNATPTQWGPPRDEPAERTA